ncbi:MAG: hypothetical protein OXF11_19675 [Deltaproteobacteria bacterium]|nr:hypothetical protein [Deltaproteobacteria bacterium]
MAWLTEAEFTYRTDVLEGKYSHSPAVATEHIYISEHVETVLNPTNAPIATPKPQPWPVTLDDIIRAVDGYKRGMAALDQLTKPFFERLAELSGFSLRVRQGRFWQC